jgi:hypothetical protein
MTIVEAMLRHMDHEPSRQCQLTFGEYHLQMVVGRPGSVCFTLEQRTLRGTTLLLAEGFSLGGRLVFDQIRLPESRIETILTNIVSQYSIAPVATLSSGDVGSADLLVGND